jgi:hypothetical protein
VKHSLVLIAAFLLFCPCTLLPAEKTEWNGYWWGSRMPSFKLGWVSGYANAMDFAATIRMSTCASNMPLFQAKYPNLDPKEILQKMCLSDTQFDYDGIPMGQFVDGIDVFYKDYRNKQLEVGWAIEYVRDEIKGKPASELNAKITMWRRCSAAYQTGETDKITKACTPDEGSAPAK